nr:hypothetical protein [uncultured Allomuricauda sp.]
MNERLQKHPDSESLLVLKIKIRIDLKCSQEASKTLNNALEYHTKSTMVQNKGIGENRNETAVAYGFIKFKERFDEPCYFCGSRIQSYEFATDNFDDQNSLKWGMSKGFES